MAKLEIGKIRTTHGIKGELKIDSHNSVFRNGFEKDLYISTNPLTKVHINKVRPESNYLLVTFKEFNDINQVEKFRGLNILIEREDLDPLKEDEYYIEDLIGMEVYNEKSVYKGDVVDVVKFPQAYYLRVKHNDRTSLIPFLDEFILEVDKIIVVKEMEGLFNDEDRYTDSVS